MKIAFLHYGVEKYMAFETMPRGANAYHHYLSVFGHDVGLFGRFFMRRPPRLLGELRRWKPSVLLGLHAGAMVGSCFRRWNLLSCPLVHTWDDYYDEQSALPTALVWPLERHSVQYADHVTSVSRYNIHRAREMGKPTTFIAHGITPEEWPAPFRLESSRFKVVYLGDQSLYKGVLRLVKAMEGLDADLFMIGPINPPLQRVAPANVHFTGPVKPMEVTAMLRQADVLVNSSDQDSNFKLQEYIRAGRPILGVEGRMAWAFEHGQDAWLVADLREGLVRLMEDPALRERLTEGVRRRRVPTWEETVRDLEAVLLRVAEEHNVPRVGA